jgi:hypothetical protein
VGLLPFLGTRVCGCGGWFGRGGEARVGRVVVRPAAGLWPRERERERERERGVVLREPESESAEESGLGLARCRSQKTDQQHNK